jgi:hypothetical protein
MRPWTLRGYCILDRGTHISLTVSPPRSSGERLGHADQTDFNR